MRRGERGAAGLLITVGMMLSTLAVFTVAAVFIAWFSAARQAEQAAELAALAAVASAVHGDAPCVAAETTAQMNGVSLRGCQVRGGGRHVVVEVTVEAPLEPALPGAPAVLHRSATAGSGAAQP